VDTDGDGIPDARDLDSDGDGVSDRAESGATGTDTDHDGIDDAFDADTHGGVDTDHDRVADGFVALDTDGDGVPDFRDLDSDNDSIADVVEAGGADENGDGLLDVDGTVTSTPADADGDGRPNLRDLDSDGDGATDISRTSFAVLDVNGDGRIDVFGADVDGDGLADAIDGEPAQRGSRIDNDEDGVPADRDQDDDGDGIRDSLEGTADTDGDGTLDRLDRDSDNDGIPDRIEMGLVRPSGSDANGNGIDDVYESVNSRRDSDNDGIPDYLDSDSDNDGMSDVLEILRVQLSGADADGDGIDDAIDVDATHGVDTNGDGVDDARLNLADTDGDGLEDYRDPDSDNDGILDGRENGDFNNDGINDRLQRDPGLRTGLEGGGGSFGWFGLMGLLAVLFARRQFREKAMACAPSALVGVGVLCAPVMQAHAEDGQGCQTGGRFSEGCWNIGVSALSTDLQPDDSRSVWQVVDDTDHGFKVSAQYRFRDRWFVELGYADMGSAVVVSRNPSITGREPVDYTVPSLLGGYLLLDPDSRFNAHVKAGYAALLTDAADNVINEQQHSSQLALGAGVSLRLWSRLRAEIEYEYYDKDAKQIALGVRYSF
jgi:opacity protein-like surface antigen